jgi:hypothetical protein
MITLTMFNEELDKLGLWYDKSISKEQAQMIYGKFNGLSLTDEQVKRVFEVAIEQPHFPVPATPVSIARDLFPSRPQRNDQGYPLVVFECPCGKSFAVLKKDLEGEGRFECPGRFYGSCNRLFNAGFLKRLARNNEDFVLIQEEVDGEP